MQIRYEMSQCHTFQLRKNVFSYEKCDIVTSVPPLRTCRTFDTAQRRGLDSPEFGGLEGEDFDQQQRTTVEFQGRLFRGLQLRGQLRLRVRVALPL